MAAARTSLLAVTLGEEWSLMLSSGIIVGVCCVCSDSDFRVRLAIFRLIYWFRNFLWFGLEGCSDISVRESSQISRGESRVWWRASCTMCISLFPPVELSSSILSWFPDRLDVYPTRPVMNVT